MSRQMLSIGEALYEFEVLTGELEKDAVNYNKRISVTEESWQRNKVYLNEKHELIIRLVEIKKAIEKLKYHDQWLHLQEKIETLQLMDTELSVVNVVIPLKPIFNHNHSAFIDLSIL
jgi:hypothetical protein